MSKTYRIACIPGDGIGPEIRSLALPQQRLVRQLGIGLLPLAVVLNKAQTQRIVMAHQRVQRLLQQPGIHRLARVQQLLELARRLQQQHRLLR